MTPIEMAQDITAKVKAIDDMAGGRDDFGTQAYTDRHREWPEAWDAYQKACAPQIAATIARALIDAEARNAAFVAEHEAEFNAAQMRAHEMEQKLVATQAALQSLSEWRVSCDDEKACAQDESGPCMGHVIDRALVGGTDALNARIHAERMDMRAVILGLVVKHIETAGKTLFPLDADEPAKAFRAALDAALARAREEMREAAVHVLHPGAENPCRNRCETCALLRALPTNGGAP